MARPGSDKLFQVFTRLDGCKFRGWLSVTELPNTKETVPFRLFLARNPALVRPGDVVNAPNGRQLLLLDHPQDRDWATSFMASFVMAAYPWRRRGKTLDPVSRMPKDTGYSDMGKVYCNFDKGTLVALGQFSDTRYRFITGQDVQVDDEVGGKVCKTVIELLGVRLVEAE